jgi:hypothetical protein
MPEALLVTAVVLVVSWFIVLSSYHQGFDNGYANGYRKALNDACKDFADSIHAMDVGRVLTQYEQEGKIRV